MRRQALRSLLLGSAALAIALPSVAFAATPAQQADPSDVEEVVITGSRIRGIAPVGSNVVAVGRQEVLESGAATTADILRQVPQVTAIGFNAEGSTGPAAPSNITRANAPNLRALGPTATLTLFDGQRVAPSGTMGQLVDPSFLPPLALERVEVIADGASAIYGSDAVAGVVNLIPRKTFKGLEVSTRGAVGDDYYDYQFGAITGLDWRGGHLVAAVDHVYNDEVETSEREFITDDRRAFGGANGLATNCASPGTATIGGVTYALPVSDGRNILRSRLTPGTLNECDASRFNRLLPETRRTSYYAYVDQNITENLKAYVQAAYSNRRFETVRGNPFLNNSTIPVTNPFRPLDVPAATAVTVSYSLVPDVGRTPSTGTAETFQTYAGLYAKLGRFQGRLSGSYGGGFDVENRKNVSTFELNRALADSNPATALNLFGAPGSNNPATLARVFSGEGVIEGDTRLKTIEASGDGPLFALPGGDVRIALGGEYRKESLTGKTLNTNAATGVKTFSRSSNSRDVKAIYGELFVPLFGEGNATTGFQRLDLSMALRYEEYSDFGNTTNPKIGVNWQMFDGFSVRGSYGTSFRAPGLSENDPLASGAAVAQGTVTLANGTRVNRITISGGNPALVPESADTWSAGFDFSPASVPGLRVSATYFNVVYQNQIIDGFSRGNLYLNNAALYPDQVAFQGTPNFARLRAAIEAFPNQPATPLDFTTPGVILVDSRRVNVGRVATDGFDFDVRYGFAVGEKGRVTLAASGTRFFSYDVSETNQAAIDQLNNIAFPAKLSGRASVSWDYGDFRSQLSADYVNSYRNANSTLVPRVDSYTAFNVNVSYAFDNAPGLARGLRLGFDIRNLFDKEPPLVDTNGAYDASKASALGRVVALTASKRW